MGHVSLSPTSSFSKLGGKGGVLPPCSYLLQSGCSKSSQRELFWNTSRKLRQPHASLASQGRCSSHGTCKACPHSPGHPRTRYLLRLGTTHVDRQRHHRHHVASPTVRRGIGTDELINFRRRPAPALHRETGSRRPASRRGARQAWWKEPGSLWQPRKLDPTLLLAPVRHTGPPVCLCRS
jgi:hypothetical protein